MLGEYLCDLSWTESENLKRVTCSVGSKFIKTISKAEVIFLFFFYYLDYV